MDLTHSLTVPFFSYVRPIFQSKHTDAKNFQQGKKKNIINTKPKKKNRERERESVKVRVGAFFFVFQNKINSAHLKQAPPPDSKNPHRESFIYIYLFTEKSEEIDLSSNGYFCCCSVVEEEEEGLWFSFSFLLLLKMDYNNDKYISLSLSLSLIGYWVCMFIVFREMCFWVCSEK